VDISDGVHAFAFHIDAVYKLFL